MFLTECARDAMQGWRRWIPTEKKIDYLNYLMPVGFDVLDCGSFVSPKIVPQMKDTAEVLDNIDKSLSSTKISVIIAGIPGAEKALGHDAVDILGFPFSLSETFQYRNTNKSQEEAFLQIQEINTLTQKEKKSFTLYFSMAFGNPYGDPWDIKDCIFWAKRFYDIGIRNILLSDTSGVATPDQIKSLFDILPNRFSAVDFGAHLHTRYKDATPKITAAYQSGCRRFDSAILGMGGCPTAKEDMVGNMPTEKILSFMHAENLDIEKDLHHFDLAMEKAKDIFGL
ncbi:MAG: hydroxymethylglutaryl-CoA lyase [Bergeyella sp.]|nr:hydroxymethylglutaryl-CoA lyase [Bergeyella sp.]